MSEAGETPAVILDQAGARLDTLQGARLLWMGWLEARASGARFFIHADEGLSDLEAACLDFLGITSDGLIGEWPADGGFLIRERESSLPDRPDNIHLIELPMMITEGGEPFRVDDPEAPLMLYRDAGYLPDALLNALALQAWNSQLSWRFFTREQMISLYQSGAIQKTDIVFSSRALREVNKAHLKRMPPRQLMLYLRPFMIDAYPEAAEKSDGWMAWATQVLQVNISTLTDVKEAARFLFYLNEEDISPHAWEILKAPIATVVLEAFAQELCEMTHFNGEECKKMLKRLKAFLKKAHKCDSNMTERAILAAIIGRLDGPPLVDVIVLIGQETCLRRAACALSLSH